MQHDTGQNILHFNQDDTTELFQNQEPQHINKIPDQQQADQQQVTTYLQNVPDPFGTYLVVLQYKMYQNFLM